MLSLNPNNAAAFYNKGLCFQEMGNYKLAIDCYLKALVKEPNFSNARNNLGICYDQIGYSDKAQEQFTIALKSAPQNSSIMNNIGICAKKKGRLEEASEAYKQAVESNPDYSLGYYNYGILLIDQGKQQEAIQAFEKARDLGVDRLLATYALGNIRENLGELNKALEEYEKIRKENPKFEGIQEKCMEIQKAIKRKNKQSNGGNVEGNERRKLSESKPKIAGLNTKDSARLNKGEMIELFEEQKAIPIEQLTNIKNDDNLNEINSKKISNEPRKIKEDAKKKSINLDLSGRKNNLLEDSKKVNEPLEISEEISSYIDNESYLDWNKEECNKKLRMNPRDIKAMFQKGCLEFASNSLSEAREIFLECREYDPSFQRSRVASYLGDIYAKIDKDWPQALKEYNESLSTANDSSVQGALHVKIGKMHEKDKNFLDAIKSYIRSCELVPDSAIPELRLGWSYIRNCEKENGLVHLRKAYEIDPENIETLEKLAEVLFRDHKTIDEAIKLLKEALKIDPNYIDALVTLSRAYEAKGQLNLAIETLEKVKEENQDVIYNMGRFYFRTGNYTKSL